MQALYKGSTLFDGENASISNQGVMVENDKVVRVAPAAEFDGFDGQIVDTPGGALMPGLIDCHIHLCLGAEGYPGTASEKLLPGQTVMKALERAQVILANGVTSVRDCGLRDYLEFAVRDACNGGDQMGPSIRASGKMTGGHSDRHGRVADSIDEVIKAAREQVHAGSDLVKIKATGGIMTPGVNPEDAHYSAEEMAVNIHEASRFHKRTASHAQVWKAFSMPCAAAFSMPCAAALLPSNTAYS